MLTNYEKPWTTEKLCAMANLEKSQFYSCYRNFFDSTPHADLNLLRLEKAKNLLTNEALPVQQVALLCGFSNLSNLSDLITVPHYTSHKQTVPHQAHRKAVPHRRYKASHPASPPVPG